MALVFATTASADLLDGLVGYWPFDGDAKDYSGNGNHGTTHGVSLINDRNGNSKGAYQFGEGKYISVAANSQLNGISDFTLSAWVKIDSWDNGYWAPIWCKGTTRAYGVEIEDGGCDLISTNSYISCFEFRYACNELVFTSQKISLGYWIHVAVTRNGGYLSAYLNGNKIGSGNGASSSGEGGNLEFGRDPPDVVEYLHGAMDDVALYNRALSSSEIHALYSGEMKVCTLSFNANGGEGTMNALQTLKGKTQALPANTFTRENYRFAGWAKTKDGAVVYADGAEVTVPGDMTLYAVWTPIIYRVRLHGNGVTTEDGAEWVDLEEEVGKGIAFPGGVFTKGKRLAGDVSGRLAGWWPVTGVYDGADDKGKNLWTGVLLRKKDIEEWKANGWMEDIGGVPTVHFYAVWMSEVLVGVSGADGKDLAPPELVEVVKYNVRHDNDWRTGTGTYAVFPGEQGLVVELESGYGAHYTVTVLKEVDYELEEVAPVGGDGAWIYADISSTEGPQKIYLGIRVEPKDEMGRVCFRCTPEMTDEQRAAWGETFPAFDAGKVRFWVLPTGKDGKGMPVGEVVSLPEGGYWVDVRYAERAGPWEYYWYGLVPGEVVVKGGETTEVEVVFRPFGKSYVDCWWIAFDGNEGRVEGETLLWYDYEGYLNKDAVPVAKRAGGWMFAGWHAPDNVLIKNSQELVNYLRDDSRPKGNLSLTAHWERVENAATESEIAVPYAWLESGAAAVLAANGGDYEAAAMAMAANGVNTVAECYVAGMNPADDGQFLKATIAVVGEKPVVSSDPRDEETRIYTVYGKKSLTDAEEDWADVTENPDPESEGYRFFRVGVKLRGE
jgi:uncharacterized repeat protein (TIGR02543 family)